MDHKPLLAKQAGLSALVTSLSKTAQLLAAQLLMLLPQTQTSTQETTRVGSLALQTVLVGFYNSFNFYGVNMIELDPVKYGALYQKVQDYERRFDEMSIKIDKLEANIEKLVEMANKSKGGFWMGMVMVSAIGSVIGYVSHWIGKS